MGTNWFKLSDGLDLGWRSLDTLGSVMWAVDCKDMLMVRDNVTQDNIEEGNSVNIFHQCPHFKLYDLQDKPSSYAVINGGWAIYEKPNFRGKHANTKQISKIH